MENKLISVIMAVHNTPYEYLDPAITSILNQTWENIEFIIIDDCSNDDTKKLLNSYKDPRIHIYHNECNLGLTKSLNKALSLTNGDYIARMDSDDISLPNRLQTQIQWMEDHPECGACGCLARLIGVNRKYYTRWNENREIRRVRLLFFNNGIVHPTAMLRKETLTTFQIAYNEEISKAQDYGLWAELIQVADIQLIPKVLFEYRIHENQISSKTSNAQFQCECVTIAKQMQRYNLTQKELEQIFQFYRGNVQDVSYLIQALNKMIEINKQTKEYNQHILTQQITVLYTQAAFKHLSRNHSFKMVLKPFFFKILLPSNLFATIHYFTKEIIYGE